MTTVFHAVGDDGADLVVKRLNQGKDIAADPVGVRRFEREIALSAMLGHPGLARVLGRGRGWIAFERLGERPSGNKVGGRLPTTPAGVKALIVSLAGVLAYLHARGIVHRDVKPAHILFREEEPVLIDLGVAGLLADDPLTGAELVGSPAWMAPEQLSDPRPKPWEDIWSLCAVGLSLLSGSPLFAGSAEDVLALRKRQAAEHVMDLVGRSVEDPQLAALLRAGLGPPEARPRAVDMAALLR